MKILKKFRFLAALAALCLLLSACALPDLNFSGAAADAASLKDIPAFDKKPYVTVNGNKPYFKKSDFTTQAFEHYSELDSRGRCGAAYANVCKKLMPTEPRGCIGQVKPSGWQIAKYDFVDGKYLYNRCHLIGFQLSGENANPRNLITGTRYLNVEGMLPFENMTADYVKETNYHVLYRVTPIFKGDNSVASGVLMEAESVEDQGKGVEFCVYCYNNQPGVTIDDATGTSRLSETADSTDSAMSSSKAATSSSKAREKTYILNTSSHKFHDPGCPGIAQIKEKNKKTFTGTREEILARGYTPCGTCKP